METLKFQTETRNLLDVVIHSLYTNKEVFLRELIANACDALDRLRLEALQHPKLLAADYPSEIRLEVDRAARTLTIRDNGIGMSRAEIIDNIGTIARSGTRDLVEQSEGVSNRPDFIGRFGVGFYSSFMVAERVTLVTRRAGEQSGTRWESEGISEYTLSEAGNAEPGTAITLYLRPVDETNGIEDYTNRWVLSRIVKAHADFVPYAIRYCGPSDEPIESNAETTQAPILLNSMKPIWTRAEAQVEPEEYVNFYQHVSSEWEPPLHRMSFKAEGRWEYAALLFVPKRAPYDLYFHAAPYGLRLYAHRMLVVDHCEQLVPRYLRFMRGIVDAADLPLNVSRQSLQDSYHLTQIRKWLSRKVVDGLSHLKETDQTKDPEVWREFGRVLKEGVSEDRDNKDRLLPLMLFESSHDADRLTTLTEYMSRMKPEQKHIYYLTGQSRSIIERSPHLEEFAARGYEVLYLTEPVDELLTPAVGEFKGCQLRSVAKGEIDFSGGADASGDAKSRDSEAFAPLLKFLERQLASAVRSVRISSRLTVSPACLVGEEFDNSPQVDRLLMRGRGAGPHSRRILEINPEHRIVTSMLGRIGTSADEPILAECADLLYGFAVIAEGSELADPVTFNVRLLDLMSRAIELDASSKTDEAVTV